jgi:hypothetical protein
MHAAVIQHNMKTMTHIRRETDQLTWQNYLEQGQNFHAYFEELVALANAVKAGEMTHDKYAHYYPLNLQRMKRGVRQVVPSEAITEWIAGMSEKIYWIVLTAQWCGDAAQTLPLFHKVEQLSNGNIQMVMLSRDEYPELMDQFLTNGGRAIPKLIQLNGAFEITATWGPRPQPAQELVMKFRESSLPYAEALHTWYATDRYKSLQTEVLDLLRQHHR